MANQLNEKSDVIDAIREIVNQLGRAPSRAEFKARTSVSEYQILKHFPGWREALRASGVEPNSTNVRLEDGVLLEDWGELVRKHRHIPTRDLYRKEGKYSPGVFEKHFGPWSAIPAQFRSFAQGNPDWADVVTLLPPTAATGVRSLPASGGLESRIAALPAPQAGHRHNKLEVVPTYGDPIDFRGLRHEPVNEQGVVFLFGMVAKELGYSVEAVQTGYPDCEAKRQIGPGKWQRVRIEFEYESRNFRDHGHPVNGCDVIVCWRHNWADCPTRLEVLELRTVIATLASTDDV
jgi:Homing endonuclease associated repeat